MQVFSISQQGNAFFSSKASVQAFKHTSQTAPVETNSWAMHKGLKKIIIILRSTFPGGSLSPTSCLKCFRLQSQILELHLTPKLKVLCAASAAERLWPVLPLLFSHYRDTDNTAQFCLSHFHGKKQGWQGEPQGERPQHIQTTKHLISPANLELREIH